MRCKHCQVSEEDASSDTDVNCKYAEPAVANSWQDTVVLQFGGLVTGQKKKCYEMLQNAMDLV
jgi:hypothetical protein